jgi:hypothetical protein
MGVSMGDEMISLREAERRTGISRFTLRDWLEDSGFAFPSIEQGSKFMISLADIESAISMHRPVPLNGYAVSNSEAPV